MNISKQGLDALTKTLNSYDDLLENFEGNAYKWNDYGRYIHCHVCAAYGKINYFKSCGECPLESMDLEYKCATKKYGCLELSLRKMLCHGQENKTAILRCARARRNEIIRHLEKLGYEYK